MNHKYDALDSWREENGFKTTTGRTVKYEGGSEYDPTAEALKAYILQKKIEEKQKQEKAGYEK